MIRRSIYFKDGKIFVDGQEKGLVMTEKPEVPNIYDCYKKIITHEGNEYVQMWVWRGRSWLCFSDTDIESFGQFDE